MVREESQGTDSAGKSKDERNEEGKEGKGRRGRVCVPEHDVYEEAVDEDGGVKQVVGAVLSALGSPPALHRHYVQRRAHHLDTIIITINIIIIIIKIKCNTVNIMPLPLQSHLQIRGLSRTHSSSHSQES